MRRWRRHDAATRPGCLSLTLLALPAHPSPAMVTRPTSTTHAPVPNIVNLHRHDTLGHCQTGTHKAAQQRRAWRVTKALSRRGQGTRKESPPPDGPCLKTTSTTTTRTFHAGAGQTVSTRIWSESNTRGTPHHTCCTSHLIPCSSGPCSLPRCLPIAKRRTPHIGHHTPSHDAQLAAQTAAQSYRFIRAQYFIQHVLQRRSLSASPRLQPCVLLSVPSH